MVYIVEDQTDFSDDDMNMLCKYLPDSRKKRAYSYLREKDRNNCIISYFLLMYGMMKEYGIRSLPELAAGKYGKPYFNDIDVCFSISHSDVSVCCGISAGEIGVDIQNMETDFEGIADMVMSENEKSIIRFSNDPVSEFTRFWTLKESICKYRGTGLTNDIDKIDFCGCNEEEFIFDRLLFRCEKRENYCISACSENTFPVFVTKEPSEYISDYLRMITN